MNSPLCFRKESAAAILRYGFDDLNLKKIFAMAVPQNKGSLHVIEKLGFRYLRDFMYKGWLHRLHEMTRGNVGSSRTGVCLSTSSLEPRSATGQPD
jgi:hypothetical protein